jgi:hypothetical protein
MLVSRFEVTDLNFGEILAGRNTPETTNEIRPILREGGDAIN